MAVMADAPSELLGFEKCVGQIDKQTYSHEGGKRVVENHGIALTAYRRHKRRRPTARKRPARSPVRQRPSWECSEWVCARARDSIVTDKRLVTAYAFDAGQKCPIFARLRANSCHALHKNSRGRGPETYRNLIKTRTKVGGIG